MSTHGMVKSSSIYLLREVVTKHCIHIHTDKCNQMLALEAVIALNLIVVIRFHQ